MNREITLHKFTQTKRCLICCTREWTIHDYCISCNFTYNLQMLLDVLLLLLLYFFFITRFLYKQCISISTGLLDCISLRSERSIKPDQIYTDHNDDMSEWGEEKKNEAQNEDSSNIACNDSIRKRKKECKKKCWMSTYWLSCFSHSTMQNNNDRTQTTKRKTRLRSSKCNNTKQNGRYDINERQSKWKKKIEVVKLNLIFHRIFVIDSSISQYSSSSSLLEEKNISQKRWVAILIEDNNNNNNEQQGEEWERMKMFKMCLTIGTTCPHSQSTK